MEEIQCLIIHGISIGNPNYMIVLYKDLKSKETFTGIGASIPYIDGMIVTLNGEWKEQIYKGKKQKNFMIKSAIEHKPKARRTIIRYLMSMNLPNLNENRILNIVNEYGADVFDIIEKEPLALQKVKGCKTLTDKACKDIRTTYLGRNVIRDYVSLLENLNISTDLSTKCLKRFGYDKEQADNISKKPYILCEVDGISFQKIDSEMKKQGRLDIYKKDRIKYGVFYCLELSEAKGDCYIPPVDLVSLMTKHLGFTTEASKVIINNMISNKEIVYFKGNIYSKYTFDAESASVEKVLDLNSFNVKKTKDLDSIIQNIESELGFTLAEKQIDAVKMVHDNAFSIITGGPGTGKTTTLNTVIKSFTDNNDEFKVVCLAPTGKASRRMSESTGLEARTIHSYLKLQGDTLTHELEMIDGDLVVVDECSMLDIYLATLLFSAVKKGTRVCLVGDVDQLPSVKAGNVFSDLIQSGVIATTKLNVTYRQQDGSPIIDNAIMINEGKKAQRRGLKISEDFQFINSSGQNELINKTIWEVQKQLQYFEPKDIIVLNPFRVSDFGVNALNKYLQPYFNPPASNKAEISNWYNATWRVGDKVMQTVNDLDKGVFNGDTGFIVEVQEQNSPERKKGIKVRFETGVELWYNTNNMKDIEHAFCMTIHKSQGSEYPCCVIMFTDEYRMFRQKRLLYTAITRAKKRVCLISTPESIRYAVDECSPLEQRARYTTLAVRLKEGNAQHNDEPKPTKKKMKDILGQLELKIASIAL